MVALSRGNYVRINAVDALFTEGSVGRQVWKKYAADGSGGGRALIVKYINSRQVIGKVTSPFDTDSLIAAGDWYFTTQSISGLDYLEGETVSVIADGGTHKDVQVLNGTVNLQFPVSRAFIGYKYRGVIKTLNIDTGGITGSAQAKPRNVSMFNLNFQNSCGTKVGTTLYNIIDLPFRNTRDKTGRPAPLFNGNYQTAYPDSYDLITNEKTVVIVQEEPLPCTLLAIDVTVETTDNGR